MGNLRYARVITVVICFALAAVFVYWQPASKAREKQHRLNEAFSHLEAWKAGGPISLDEKVVKSLDLDDYLNQNYSNDSETISLYIGYYLTGNKVGASHSPLVCFPGQGWVLSGTESKSVRVGQENLGLTVMVATKGETKELILYWFQAFDTAHPETFRQKVYAFWAKLVHHREDNAFVRVSLPMTGKDREKTFQTGISFLEVFYPRFLEYVKEST